MIKTHLIFISILLSTGLSFGKIKNVKNQLEDSTKIITKYNGGRVGYSSISLILYDDLTYKLSEWMHTGTNFSEIGKFSLSDSLITFYPNISELKHYGKRRKKIKGRPKSYLINGENILMYNPEDDENGFSAEYRTLYKKEI